MGKVLYSDFEGVETIIESMMDNPQLKKAVTRTNLYNFWDSILPDKYKSKSRPFSMLPGGVMVVACENPVIAQELSLRKIMLISKFTPYAKSMKIKLTDMRFDPKKWTTA
ncbi:MAG: DUF721 domain-containing protein [bacterium]|nr:DUF721 domain-containing protein [bacterium]